MSGFTLKGALVEFMPSFLPFPVPNVIVFQYNPETMTHTWTQPAAGRHRRDRDVQPVRRAGHAGRGVLLHDRHGRERRDRRREHRDGGARPGDRDLQPARRAGDAALPGRRTTNPLVGAVSAAISSALGGGSSGPTRTVPQSVVPVTLFIWGAERIVPVRVTGLTITEKLYDSALNPTHAEAQVTLRVLTPAELVAASADNDVLGKLATVAYTYTLTLRQALAVANLANAAESIIGMLPH